MNLYTSNFESKLHLKLFFLIIILLYVFLNVAAYRYTAAKISQQEHLNNFINNVSGKFHMLQKAYVNSKPDVIFIGSSTTQMHVSTATFQNAGIHAFNYGVQGRFVTHYPEMVKNAIRLKPKTIAILIDKHQFYYPELSKLISPGIFTQELDISLTNIKFFLQQLNSYDSYKIAAHLLVGYFIHLNYFTVNGFDVSDSIIHYYNHPLSIFKSNVTSPALEINLACDYFPEDKSMAKRNCNNGDLVMFNQAEKFNFAELKPVHYETINPQFVSVINGLIDMIKSAGIQALVVLIPQRVHYDVDNIKLANSLNAMLIDLSDTKLPHTAWYNSNHYNVEGRAIFSTILLNKLEPIIV